jgi:methionine biosynthesis protein MetW
MGVELACESVIECASHDLPVVHADLDEGLGSFADGQFDVVVLSQTLQLVNHVEALLDEMLRVGRRAVVSFSNASRASNRRRMVEEGRAPQPLAFERDDVFAAPPMRQFSIRDFEALCERRGLSVERRLGVRGPSGDFVEGELDDSVDVAVFVLARAGRRRPNEAPG